MKWLVVNRYKQVVLVDDDLDHAWEVCECASRCGESLTVASEADYKTGNY